MNQSNWSVKAKTLPEHSRNPIHTDEGGRAAGFDGALVAGVTVYAYLTNPIVKLWGVDWLRRGSSIIEFKSPVLANQLVECITVLEEESLEVNATVENEIRAQCTAFMNFSNTENPILSSDELLEVIDIHLVDEWEDYGRRAGDDHEIYSELGLVHPAIWPAVANHVVERNLVDGAWIHTRSKIFHHDSVQIGSVATVESYVVRRFETRAGDRVVVNVSIAVDGEKVADVEHEAIVSLTSNKRSF